jgi:ATP-binding cassette subfamily B (MDR/TAP) protein 1
MGKARQAAGNIARILEMKPKIDTWSDEGDVLPFDSVQGGVEFKDVHFRYPTRPNVPVLRGLNLTVKKGQYVALVGSSGCGKSTTISLIERFYSPLGGAVLLDGHDISTLNVNEYRKHIALVQQEPVLYSGTLRENIMLGTIDDERDVTEEEMFAAAKKANIHDFIMSLPDGYETFAGSKGALLSGGQKQRIAIARALIRNPKVLLLDEATSALDSESEKVVQAALDEAAKGRTTIAVAHRLSTIQNADVIYVFENGKILESGTHQQLLANKRKYYELVQMQSLEN